MEVSAIVCATKGAFNEKDWNYTMPILADELALDAIRMQTIKKYQVNNLVFMDDEYRLVCVPFKTKNKKGNTNRRNIAIAKRTRYD